ncbi:glycoside hydrolase family 105 protein [Pendulispora albinea]|uniref:Glycoside hydrolase family 88 protein n=1 Tax=Pendulispora albinea TaxID=2741071 RepID=A0ABZ2LVR8_9BACT
MIVRGLSVHRTSILAFLTAFALGSFAPGCAPAASGDAAEEVEETSAAPLERAAPREGAVEAADAPLPDDLSVAIVESTMQRYTPDKLGGWSYTRGLYLWGQYLVYQRTHDARYLNYIKAWVDRFVDKDGHLDNGLSNLDSMESGNPVLALYRETRQDKYRLAAKQIRDRLKTYPRTSDGGFWHATSTSRQHQLWADGVFMVNPFLARYGQWVGEASYANDEAAKQLAVYGDHLQVANGLLKHAYDESRKQSWADPKTGLAPEHWCRAIGWYGMATIDILEILPLTHPRRADLISKLKKLVAGFKTYQDPASGRWFQVVDKGNLSGNWTETSCSAMYTYTISRAVERGYIDASYRAVSAKGYEGVLQRISIGSDGRTNVAEISIGTNVGDVAYYLARARETNDFHGLGAVLIMNEQLRRTGGDKGLGVGIDLDLDIDLGIGLGKP